MTHDHLRFVRQTVSSTGLTMSSPGQRQPRLGRASRPGRTRNCDPSWPSTIRWSKDSESWVTLRTANCPSTTHGVSRTAPSARIAVSPGLRIGRAAVDAEHADVGDRDRPAGHVRRRGPAGPGRLGQLPQRDSASSRTDSRARVLDVGHDQPARGGSGDAEVDVVLDHDLLRLLVPGGVDHRIPADREQQRPGHEQQRADLDPGELAASRRPGPAAPWWASCRR